LKKKKKDGRWNRKEFFKLFKNENKNLKKKRKEKEI